MNFGLFVNVVEFTRQRHFFLVSSRGATHHQLSRGQKRSQISVGLRFQGVQRLRPHGKTQQVISLFFDFTEILVPEQYQSVQILISFFLPYYLIILH